MARSKEMTNLQKELLFKLWKESKKLKENLRQPKYPIYYYYFINCELGKTQNC